MAKIILDLSANTHKNNEGTIAKVISLVRQYDTGKNEIIFKGQLFEAAGKNIVCTHDSFTFMYNFCKDVGYDCTASVFDRRSLNFLLSFDIPFVKIACRPDLYWLEGEIPRRIPRYISVSNPMGYMHVCNDKDVNLYCVPEYPAKIEDYIYQLIGVPYSDHTVGLELFKKREPSIWEKHIKLQDSTGLDAGPWAITPEELADVL